MAKLLSEVDLVAPTWFDDLAAEAIEEAEPPSPWLDDLFANLDVIQYKERPLHHSERSLTQNTGMETKTLVLAVGESLPGAEFIYRPRLNFTGLHDVKVTRAQYVKFRKRIDNFLKSYIEIPNIQLSTRDVNRWKFASRAVKAFSASPVSTNMLDDFIYEEIPKIICGGDGFFGVFVSQSDNSLPIQQAMHYVDRSLKVGLIVAAFVYGGLHALAWFAHFESPAEELLWRISASMVMGGLPILFFQQLLLDKIYRYYERRRRPYLSHFPYKIYRRLYTSFPINIPTWIILGAYTLARTYLVVECFINLSHMPAGVYDSPKWSAYVPHIS